MSKGLLKFLFLWGTAFIAVLLTLAFAGSEEDVEAPVEVTVKQEPITQTHLGTLSEVVTELDDRRWRMVVLKNGLECVSMVKPGGGNGFSCNWEKWNAEKKAHSEESQHHGF